MMTANDILTQIEEPLHILRTYLTRARFIMQDVMEDFCHMEFNNKDSGEWWKVAHEFPRNTARCEIVEDAILHIFDAQLTLDNIEKRINDEVYGSASDPIETATPAASPTTNHQKAKKGGAQA